MLVSPGSLAATDGPPTMVGLGMRDVTAWPDRLMNWMTDDDLLTLPKTTENDARADP